MASRLETETVAEQILHKLSPCLDEKQRRMLYGSVASALGHGGIAFVNEVTGAARATIVSGMEEITSSRKDYTARDSGSNRIRKPGAGRKSTVEKYPMLYARIEDIITRYGSMSGCPKKPLRWITWSLRQIAHKIMTLDRIHVSQNIVSRALEALGYSKHQNQKMCHVGRQYPDRDAQFRFINDTASVFLSNGEPVISVDARKKENIGIFRNNGVEYRPVKSPHKVSDDDIPSSALGKVSPYNVYVPNDNTGFVNLGLSHNTSEFAGESIAQWWRCIGKHTFPDARRIYIICDLGGSDARRIRLWKNCVQELANESWMDIHVSHFPTGTSKWNRIEHRLFCYISKIHQGQSLVDVEATVDLIGSTTTGKGLSVQCHAGNNQYQYDIDNKITEEQEDNLEIKYVGPNEQWNYIIQPNSLFVNFAYDTIKKNTQSFPKKIFDTFTFTTDALKSED